jgi:hypothetical protein
VLGTIEALVGAADGRVERGLAGQAAATPKLAVITPDRLPVRAAKSCRTISAKAAASLAVTWGR